MIAGRTPMFIRFPAIASHRVALGSLAVSFAIQMTKKSLSVVGYKRYEAYHTLEEFLYESKNCLVNSRDTAIGIGYSKQGPLPTMRGRGYYSAGRELSVSGHN